MMENSCIQSEANQAIFSVATSCRSGGKSEEVTSRVSSPLKRTECPRSGNGGWFTLCTGLQHLYQSDSWYPVKEWSLLPGGKELVSSLGFLGAQPPCSSRDFNLFLIAAILAFRFICPSVLLRASLAFVSAQANFDSMSPRCFSLAKRTTRGRPETNLPFIFVFANRASWMLTSNNNNKTIATRF